MNIMRNFATPARIIPSTTITPVSDFEDETFSYLDELQEQEELRMARAGVRRNRMMKADYYGQH